MTTTTKTPTTLRFFFNGLKVGTGKLQRGSWSLIERWTRGDGAEIQTQLVLYSRDGFSPEVWEALTVTNNSDLMTDYFESDRLSILPSAPVFAAAAAAYEKDLNRDIARCIKKGDLTSSARYTSELLKLRDVIDAAR